MDSGFYRGTNTDQDTRFTDKEKKLLKQMKFEDILDTKVDLNKINVDVLKPWITCKLNDILGMEDDVVVEYVFTQLEEKNLNPKVMQINLTGFLNARRAREFMGELWQMFVEAQSSPDGIPAKLVEKKVEELKLASANNEKREQSFAKAVETDWKHRYQSLTGGRYGGQPSYYQDRGEELDLDDDRDRRRRGPDDDRDRYLERRVEREEKFFKERKELLRERRRTPSPLLRRFSEKTEEKVNGGRGRDRGDRERDRGGESRTKRRNGSKERSDDESNDDRRKRKKKRHHRGHSSESETERKPKSSSSKKHKKDKKKRKRD